MSLKSNLSYLLDKHKISKAEYLKLTNLLEGHDRQLKTKVINDMEHRLYYEFEDAIGVPNAMKTFAKEVVKQTADKMKGKQN
jgi:hypothetical protein